MSVLRFFAALLVSVAGTVGAQEGPRRLPPVPTEFTPAVVFDAVSAARLPAQVELADARTVVYQLDELEALAIAQNPAISEARSHVEAARGRSLQARLRPNPKVGYMANEIGNESAGQHGAFVGQQFIRGGKLAWSSAVECREVIRLQRELDAMQQAVLTDVRNRFFSIYWLQKRTLILEQFLETNRRAKTIAEQLFYAGDNIKSDVLLAEIEYEQTLTDIAALSADLEANWRSLARVVGDSQLAPGTLGDAFSDIEDMKWDDALARIQNSPRLAAANAEIDRNRTALQRARVEPIPDVNTQVSVQYDFSTNNTFAGVQVGMPVPTWNRNQGGIYAANASVRAAMQKYEKTRLHVERELAQQFGLYENARRQLTRIEQQIVPKAQEVVKIALNAYKAGEAGMADVLNAQRSLLRAALRQQDAQLQLRLAYVAIEGYLLSDGLGG